MTSAATEEHDARALLRHLDAEIRDALRAAVRQGDAFLRLLNRRDGVRIALHDRRHALEPERVQFLTARLAELDAAVQHEEGELTIWSDRLRGLQAAERRAMVAAESARPQQELLL